MGLLEKAKSSTSKKQKRDSRRSQSSPAIWKRSNHHVRSRKNRKLQFGRRKQLEETTKESSLTPAVEYTFVVCTARLASSYFGNWQYSASCCHDPESSAGGTDEANLRSCNHAGACHGHMGAASAAAKCSSGIAGNVLQQNPGDIRKTSS